LSAITAINRLSHSFRLAVSVVALAGCHRAPEPADAPVVTFLCYHTFDSAKPSPYTVDSRQFEEQMRFLAVQHIPVIPLSDYLSHLEHQTPLPPRSVVITMDDGYRAVRTKAWPVLKRHGFPFTLFVYPQAIGRHASALTWPELRRMSRAGVDIQSHSLTHPLLTHPPQAMSPEEYRDWVDNELRQSKEEIETQLHKPVTALAYPFGGYDEFIVERVRAAGYRMALTCDDGDVSRRSDPWHLHRRLVYRRNSVKRYVKFFMGKPLVLADLSPRDGERIRGPVREIQARVVNVKEILPETAKIIVDKLGNSPQPAPIDAKTGQLRFPLPVETKRGYYFVSLMARDRASPDLWRETSWLFIISRNTSKNR
jgi:peptidoglycan/xylan/chitin deacetylase (PgdA/CDA1 family)